MKTYLNFLLSVSNSIKFSKFDFPRSIYVWCVKKYILLVAKIDILPNKLSKSKSNNKSNKSK